MYKINTSNNNSYDVALVVIIWNRMVKVSSQLLWDYIGPIFLLKKLNENKIAKFTFALSPVLYDFESLIHC